MSPTNYNTLIRRANPLPFRLTFASASNRPSIDSYPKSPLLHPAIPPSGKHALPLDAADAAVDADSERVSTRECEVLKLRLLATRDEQAWSAHSQDDDDARFARWVVVVVVLVGCIAQMQIWAVRALAGWSRGAGVRGKTPTDGVIRAVPGLAMAARIECC